jgi:hypothetical protein
MSEKKPNRLKEQSKKVATAVKQKRRDWLDGNYQAKRVEAVALLGKIRDANPKFSPADVLTYLESNLTKAEKNSGFHSSEFANAAAMYVLISFEVRQLDSSAGTDHQKLVDLITSIDNGLVNGTRKALGAAIGLALFFLPAGKVTKAISAVLAVTAKYSPLTKKALKTVNVSKILITRTNEVLGAAPEKWHSDRPKTGLFKRLVAAFRNKP